MRLCSPGGRSPLKMGSALRVKNLLLLEQILYSKSGPILKFIESGDPKMCLFTYVNRSKFPTIDNQ